MYDLRQLYIKHEYNSFCEAMRIRSFIHFPFCPIGLDYHPVLHICFTYMYVRVCVRERNRDPDRRNDGRKQQGGQWNGWVSSESQFNWTIVKILLRLSGFIEAHKAAPACAIYNTVTQVLLLASAPVMTLTQSHDRVRNIINGRRDQTEKFTEWTTRVVTLMLPPTFNNHLRTLPVTHERSHRLN